MYICICNAITDKQIRHAARSGVHNLWQLQRELGVASACGSCKEQAVKILRETHAGQVPAQPAVYQPQVA